MSMETRGTKTYCGCTVAEASLSEMAGTTMALKMTKGGGEILGQPYRERGRDGSREWSTRDLCLLSVSSMLPFTRCQLSLKYEP